jgi:hypothetical protein
MSRVNRKDATVARQTPDPGVTATRVDTHRIPLHAPRWTAAGIGGPCLILGLAVAWRDPFAWLVLPPLLAYAAALWRWPVLFLLLLPAVIAAFDLGLWTGWMMLSEADPFVLVTIGVLALRAPPSRADLLPPAWPGRFLELLGAVWLLATIIGLARPFGFTGDSVNAFLRPDNALRLAKPLLEALALLPFIRQRQRTHGDAAPWFARGMAVSLIAVVLPVLAERSLFAGVLDFRTDYRVAGPFSSMRVGGGHIGAYAALALPFALAATLERRARSMAIAAAIAGAYTLAVTYARTAYASGLAGVATTGLVWLIGQWRAGGRPTRLALLPLAAVLLAVAAAAASPVMRHRFAEAAGDLLTRESNWRAGWAVRDPDWATSFVGMGLGTYQRAMLARSATLRPSDLDLEHDAAGPFVSLRSNTPFYLGQKVSLPAQGSVRLSLLARRTDDRGELGILLCDKVLLFSDNCRGPQVALAAPGVWQAVAVTLPVAGLGRSAWGGLLHRPVELSLFDPVVGTRLDLRDIRLTDMAGRSLLANGGFDHGLDRWLFTDDSHVSWRILNQYLMLLFETGILGLLAMLAVCAAAFGGGVRSGLRAQPVGAAVAGSVVTFLISGLFDNVLEAPRLSLLIFLVCGMGLLLWHTPETSRTGGGA